jgi:ribosomal protein L44E
MIGAPRGVGNKARDSVSLKEVALFHLNLVAECTNCGHKRLIGTNLVLDLIERYGADMTMQRLAPKLKCDRCQRKKAEILFRTGDRRDDWWPRRPQEQRH